MLIQNFIPTRFLKSTLWEGHTTSKNGKQVPGPSPQATSGSSNRLPGGTFLGHACLRARPQPLSPHLTLPSAHISISLPIGLSKLTSIGHIPSGACFQLPSN